MGAEEYLEEIYRDMYPLLLRYAQSALEGDALLAEEVVQEGFVIAWGKVNVLMGSPNPQGWMVETVKHVIQNTRRSREKSRRAAEAAAAVATMEVVLHTDEEQVDLLYGDLAGDEGYELMKEYALEDKTVGALAQARGITAEACKKRLQRARAHLKKYFQKNCGQVSPFGDDLFHTQIGVGNRLDGGRRRVKKYLWSFLRTAPAGQVRP